MHWFLKFIFGVKLHMFWTVPLSIIRRFLLYTQEWYMSYRFADSLWAGSGRSVLILPESCRQTRMTYTIGVCTAKNSWWWTEQLSKTCGVYSKNKFEKLVCLVGLIIRIHHDARSPERQNFKICVLSEFIRNQFHTNVMLYHSRYISCTTVETQNTHIHKTLQISVEPKIQQDMDEPCLSLHLMQFWCLCPIAWI